MVSDPATHFPASAIDRWPIPPDLRERCLTPEWMDDTRLDAAEHRLALAGLGRLNRLGGAAGLLWPLLMREISRCPRRPLRVLDVACGSGDVLRQLHRCGRIIATGADISSEAIAHASQPRIEGLGFRVLDVLAEDVELPRADVVICSLFLHHLSNDQVVMLLGKMGRAARRRIIVSDLERSRTSWIAVWLAARLATRSRVVHHDSARSVEAGWRAGELESLARRARLTHVQVARAMPCRLIMTARPTPTAFEPKEQ